MGLFDFLSKKDKADPKKKVASDREVARFAKLVATKMSQNYDRQEAIEELGKVGTAESATALLKRFDWSMDPSITDQEEKQSAMNGIVAAGEAALEPIRRYCKKAESLTWPLKTLRAIVAEDQYVEEVLGILDLFDTEYVRNAEPKVQLLKILEEFPSTEVREAIQPFLTDAGEPVRFAAVTTCFAMNEPEAVPALIAALEEEESLRVKNRIAQGLGERRWAVPEELRETCAASLPPDFRLDGEHVRRVS
jgi:HEAT repeat protein